MTRTGRFLLVFALGSLVGPAPAAAGEAWSTLRGKFVLGEGTIPKAARLKIQQGMHVCGKAPLMDETLQIDRETRGIRDVVVWVDKPTAIHPEATKNREPVVVDNRHCRFEPHVTLVPAYRGLRVTNSDTFGHNFFASFFKNQAANPVIPAKGAVPVIVKRSEITPIVVTCGMHPWMNCVVLVQDHPYMAKSDARGRFVLKNLPRGDLTLRVWHQKLGWIKSVTVDGKRARWNRGRYSITLEKDREHTYTLDAALFVKKK